MAKGGRDRNDRRDDRRDDRRRDDRSSRRNVRNDALRLTVLGLPRGITWQDLKDLMRKAGEVQYTNISGDEGYSFCKVDMSSVVEFIDQDGKDKALEMFNGYDYQGSTITLKDVSSLFPLLIL